MFPRTPSRFAMAAALVAVLLAAASAATLTLAGDPENPVAEGPTGQAAVDRASLAASPAPEPTLHTKVAAVIADRDARLEELRAEFAVARNEQEALAAQRAIERLQHRAEADILRLQLAFAQERTDAATVAELEESLALMGAGFDETELERDLDREDER